MTFSDLDCAEIDLAPEFVCLSFNACGASGLRLDDLAALEMQDSQ